MGILLKVNIFIFSALSEKSFYGKYIYLKEQRNGALTRAKYL
jgi:hypothetical protein